MACPGCLPLLLMGTFVAGQDAHLSCTINSQHATAGDIGDIGVSWYQQQPGSAPHLLYYYAEEEHYRPDDIPDRFSATVDAAHNACILTISPVLPEDDAVYFCSIAHIFEP